MDRLKASGVETDRAPSSLVVALRWLVMFPAAIVAAFLGALLGRFTLFLRGSGYPDFLFPLVSHLPVGFAFVMVAAFVAPKYQSVTAMLMALFWGTLSISLHILIPSSPGTVNVMHVLGESLGGMFAVFAVIKLLRKSELCKSVLS